MPTFATHDCTAVSAPLVLGRAIEQKTTDYIYREETVATLPPRYPTGVTLLILNSFFRRSQYVNMRRHFLLFLRTWNFPGCLQGVDVS